MIAFLFPWPAFRVCVGNLSKLWNDLALSNIENYLFPFKVFLNSFFCLLLSSFQSGMMIAPVLANLGPLETLTLHPNPSEVNNVVEIFVLKWWLLGLLHLSPFGSPRLRRSLPWLLPIYATLRTEAIHIFALVIVTDTLSLCFTVTSIESGAWPQ